MVKKGAHIIDTTGPLSLIRLRVLSDAGDEVEVVVPDNSEDAPPKAHGFTVNNIPGFKFPMYPLITLGKPLEYALATTSTSSASFLTNLVAATNPAFDVRMKALSAMRRFKPDILHVSSPSFLVGVGVVTARVLGVPLVLSYHTHLPVREGCRPWPLFQ